ncbi:hypothetical protein DOTSEDRAFT_82674 [Dothistroma septosporum NZE10]|uniref:Uncharacterized protein n=1 Tax=Dothistroma septosporum (strain NZE10 / CBS 128990) TaxID=675120 RepID=N1PCX8_DOTSN|nr:hypothetical protein DOTSEDRAFT_82674 [Dothistroma septosporum NZE10]
MVGPADVHLFDHAHETTLFMTLRSCAWHPILHASIASDRRHVRSYSTFYARCPLKRKQQQQQHLETNDCSCMSSTCDPHQTEVIAARMQINVADGHRRLPSKPSLRAPPRRLSSEDLHIADSHSTRENACATISCGACYQGTELPQGSRGTHLLEGAQEINAWLAMLKYTFEVTRHVNAFDPPLDRFLSHADVHPDFVKHTGNTADTYGYRTNTLPATTHTVAAMEIIGLPKSRAHSRRLADAQRSYTLKARIQRDFIHLYQPIHLRRRKSHFTSRHKALTVQVTTYQQVLQTKAETAGKTAAGGLPVPEGDVATASEDGVLVLTSSAALVDTVLASQHAHAGAARNRLVLADLVSSSPAMVAVTDTEIEPSMEQSTLLGATVVQLP